MKKSILGTGITVTIYSNEAVLICRRLIVSMAAFMLDLTSDTSTTIECFHERACFTNPVKGACSRDAIE